MSKLVFSVLALAIVGFAANCSATDQSMHSHDSLKASSGWCDSCKVGFLDSKEVKCKDCYTAKTEKSGWCEGCNVGYINGKKVSCKGCVESAKTGKKCPTCTG